MFKSSLIQIVVLLSLLFSVITGCAEPQDRALSDEQRLIEAIKTDAVFKTYYQHPSISSTYSMDVSVSQGHIYLNGTLYGTVTYTEELELTYPEGFVSFAEHCYEDVPDTLEKLRRHRGCYILETDAQKRSGKRLALYEIDGYFYIITFFESGIAEGRVMRIHSNAPLPVYTN